MSQLGQVLLSFPLCVVFSLSLSMKLLAEGIINLVQMEKEVFLVLFTELFTAVYCTPPSLGQHYWVLRRFPRYHWPKPHCNGKRSFIRSFGVLSTVKYSKMFLLQHTVNDGALWDNAVGGEIIAVFRMVHTKKYWKQVTCKLLKQKKRYIL